MNKGEKKLKEKITENKERGAPSELHKKRGSIKST